MLIPFFPSELHGWLDEIATLSYLGAAVFLGFPVPALGLVLVAAVVHLTNTRLTDYPHGSFKLYSLSVHARIELCEGAAILAGAIALTGLSNLQVMALYVFGTAQVGTALLSDLRAPPRLPAARI